MRLKDFERGMKKSVFTLAEAALVAHGDSPAALRLNLHRWTKAGDLLGIRRGVYAFPHRPSSTPEMIGALYPPAYVSLESALSQAGLLPDVPFETTLITPRATRSFSTPRGRFHFHRIQPRLFFGYDSKTLFADPEKAILDYFYLKGSSLHPQPAFWEEARFQNLDRVNWSKGDRAARVFPQGRVRTLWASLKTYAKAHRRP